MNRVLKRLLVAATAAFASAAVLLTPAHAAGSPPIEFAGSFFGHQCVKFADDGSYQAIICADIITGTNSAGYYAKGQAEAYCQNEQNQVVGCDAVYINAGLYNESNVNWQGDYPTPCGDGYANCVPNGQRNYYSLNTFQYNSNQWNLNNCSSNTNNATQVWSVVFFQSDIRLPDGNIYDLGYTNLPPNDGMNETSGHYFICP